MSGNDEREPKRKKCEVCNGFFEVVGKETVEVATMLGRTTAVVWTFRCLDCKGLKYVRYNADGTEDVEL